MWVQDPDGGYIKRWVPELAQLPRKYLHQPWLAPPDVLEAAGVKFGSGPGCYPHRIITAVMQVGLLNHLLLFTTIFHMHWFHPDKCCAAIVSSSFLT